MIYISRCAGREAERGATNKKKKKKRRRERESGLKKQHVSDLPFYEARRHSASSLVAKAISRRRRLGNPLTRPPLTTKLPLLARENTLNAVGCSQTSVLMVFVELVSRGEIESRNGSLEPADPSLLTMALREY